MRKFTLSLIEPSEPAAGAILVVDKDGNDIAEFYHSEHATVGQSYQEAISLARRLVGANDSGTKPLQPLTEKAVLRVLGLLNVYAPDVFDLEMAANVVSQSLQAVDEYSAPEIERSRNVSETQPRSGIHKSGNTFPVDGNETGTCPDADFLRDRQQDAEMRGDL